ncbi:MAG: ABC transporter permease [Verrucomicrobiae bacterium]|nr:ABC transporter permease [Verrucomicrobiae bacterium]
MASAAANTARPVPRLRFGESVGLLVVLGLVIAAFGAFSDHFLTANTFRAVANEVPALTVVAVGMTFVILTAGIDLSVGSVLTLAGAVQGIAMVDWHWPLAAAISLAMLAGLTCGWISGFVSVRFAVPTFIVTLGMLQFARGLTYLVTESRTKYIGRPVEWLATPLPGLRLSTAFLVAVAVVAAGQFVLKRTVFGRYVLVVGANEEAATLSGIRTRPIKVLVFMIAGATAGLGAAFNLAKIPTVDPNAGIGLELSAIAAVVIGGTSLMGGRGSVTGSFLGVLIMATLNAGLTQVATKDWMKYLVSGVVIVLAVIVDAWRIRNRKSASA